MKVIITGFPFLFWPYERSAAGKPSDYLANSSRASSIERTPTALRRPATTRPRRSTSTRSQISAGSSAFTEETTTAVPASVASRRCLKIWASTPMFALGRLA